MTRLLENIIPQCILLYFRQKPVVVTKHVEKERLINKGDVVHYTYTLTFG